MFKRSIALAAVLLAVAVLLSACAEVPGPATPTDAPVVTDAPTENPTDVPTAAPTDTPEPTATPEPTPTPEPKPQVNYKGDAVLVDIEDDSLIQCSSCDYEIKSGEPWLTITTDTGDNYIIFNFEETVYADEHPYIAFKYRIGYGQSIRPTNHFYAVTAAGGPSPAEGMWSDIDFVDDLDWHTAIIKLEEQFPAAGTEWRALRCPTVDTVGGDYAIAWFGAFSTEEDIAAYDAAFNEVYGEKLVKAEKPKTQKKESVPDKLVNAFEESVYDFEDCSDGDQLADYYGVEWMPSLGLRNSVFKEYEGSIVLNLKFDAFYHDSLVKAGKGFTAKFDFKNDGARGGNFGGFVFGFGDENNSNRDFYENSYGKDGVDSLVGKSGIGVDFREGNKIYVFVNRWNTEKNKRDVVGAEIETAVNFDEKIVSFVIDDDGTSKITVTADGQLLFTVEYGDAGLIDDAVGYNEQYFRSVSVTDAAGTQIINVDTALFSIYDSFGFGARARNLLIDNIDIKTK